MVTTIDLCLSISKSIELEIPQDITNYKEYFRKSETWKHLKQVLKNSGFFIDNYDVFCEED